MAGAHRIRAASAADADALAAVIHELGGFRAFDGASAGTVRDAVRVSLAAALDAGASTLLVAEDDDGVFGWAHVHWLHELVMPGPDAYLTELFVAASHQGRGIGGALHDRVVAEARERGAHRLTLLNGKERASYANGFYARRGWCERDEVAAFVLPLSA